MIYDCLIMALILLSNLIIQKAYPKLLKPASNITEIACGAILKIGYESLLLQTEFTCYTKLISPLLMIDVLIPSNASNTYVLLSTTIIFMTIAKYPSIIPLVRTGYGIYKKNIRVPININVI